MANNQRGQGLTEYALILALVAIVVIVSVALLGTTLGDAFTSVTNAIPG